MYPWTHLPPPLSVREFHVLFALYRAESTVYGLRGQIELDTFGSVKIPDGTIYPLMVRLHDQGLIDLVRTEVGDEVGKPRKIYGLSENGTSRLREEFTRIEHVVKLARASGILDFEVPNEVERLLRASNFSAGA